MFPSSRRRGDAPQPSAATRNRSRKKRGEKACSPAALGWEPRGWFAAALLTAFEFSTSKDGEAFTPLNPMRARGVVDNVRAWGDGLVWRIGLFAGSGSARNAAPIDASFDFFKVTAVPAQRESPPTAGRLVADSRQRTR